MSSILDSQELRKTLPDGTVDHSLVLAMNFDDQAPRKVSTLDITKPCVFFFGGGAYLCKGEEAVPSQMKSMQELLAPAITSANYHFYTLTNDKTGSKETGIFDAGKKNQLYNDYPKTFSTKEAESFVDTYLAPLAADLKQAQPADKAQLVQATARQFSAITFFGYSYGTVFVQEISNALNTALEEKGYSDKQRATVMKALAAVNIGPTFKYIPKYPDLSQTTFVLGNDKDAVINSGLNISNPYLEFAHPVDKLAYAQNEAHTIIHIADGSTRLRSASYRAVPSNSSLPELIDEAKRWSESTASTQDKATLQNQVVRPHHKGLQTANFRYRVDPDTIDYTFPSNLVGINTARFLQAAVKGSADAAQQSSVRDMETITQQSVAKHLNADAVKKDAVQMRFYQQMFDGLAENSTPSR